MSKDKNIIKQKTNNEKLLDAENNLELCKKYFSKYRNLSLDMQRGLLMDMDRIIALGCDIEEKYSKLEKENNKLQEENNHLIDENDYLEDTVEDLYDDINEYDGWDGE